MSVSRTFHHNLWALTVLSLLHERSMHPYEMQRLIRERHKDDVLDLKAGSLYHAINRLEKAGLIEAVETVREGRRPERTVYRITESGVDELLEWLREILSRPSGDVREYIAGISNMAHLTPEDAISSLESRSLLLEGEIAAIETMLRTVMPRIGRFVLLETELMLELKRTELEWTCRLIDDLRSGVFVWRYEDYLADPSSWPGKPPDTCEEEKA